MMGEKEESRRSSNLANHLTSSSRLWLAKLFLRARSRDFSPFKSFGESSFSWGNSLMALRKWILYGFIASNDLTKMVWVP